MLLNIGIVFEAYEETHSPLKKWTTRTQNIPCKYGEHFRWRGLFRTLSYSTPEKSHPRFLPAGLCVWVGDGTWIDHICSVRSHQKQAGWLYVYDFSRALLAQDSVQSQRAGSDPHWSQAKETLSGLFFPISSIPRCGFTKTQSGSALSQTLGFFCI